MSAEVPTTARRWCCVHGTLGDFRTWNAGARPAVEEASRDLAEPAALLSGALGRRRQRLSDGAARRRRDRLHRGTECRAGRSDGPFPRRPYRISRGAGAAGFAAQDWFWPNRAAISTPRCSRPVRRPAPCRWGRAFRSRPRRSRSGDIDGALALFVDRIDGEGAWTRLAGRAEAAIARQRPYAAWPGRREPQAVSARAKRNRSGHRRLLIGGGDTKGGLAVNWRVLARAYSGRKDRGHPGHRATGCSNRRRRNFATWCWIFSQA